MVFSNKLFQFILIALVASIPLGCFANNAGIVTAQEAQNTESVSTENKLLSKEEKAEADRKAFVKHHLLDSHDFTLFSYGKDEKHQSHFGFSLPIILWDNGIHVFSSSKFEHGEAVVESNGNFYKINHHDGRIYKTNSNGEFQENEKGHVTNDMPIDFQ